MSKKENGEFKFILNSEGGYKNAYISITPDLKRFSAFIDAHTDRRTVVKVRDFCNKMLRAHKPKKKVKARKLVTK